MVDRITDLPKVERFPFRLDNNTLFSFSPLCLLFAELLETTFFPLLGPVPSFLLLYLGG